MRPPPTSTLFPYTTLFRSRVRAQDRRWHVGGGGHRIGHVGTDRHEDRKSTRLNSSHVAISYAVFCLKKKTPFLINYQSLSSINEYTQFTYRTIAHSHIPSP